MLSSNTPSGFWFDAWALASPYPLSVSLPCHPSVSSVIQSVGVEALSLGSALCRWVLPSVIGLHPPSLGSTLRCWASPSIVGFYPLSLGFTLHRWVLPSVVGLHPPSLGSTLRRWASPSVVGFYPPSLGSALHHWALPSTAGFYPSSLSSALRVASATSSSSSCCPPHPPRHALYALRLSFNSTVHLVDLCPVVRVHIVSGGFMLRCLTLRCVVLWNHLAVVELVGVLGMVAGPWHSRRGGGSGGW